MNSSSVPKTFLIYASHVNGEITDSGFIRIFSYQDSKGDIIYKLSLVNSKSKASRYLNFDNTKKFACNYIEKYNLKNVKIIDTASGKTSNIKDCNKQKNQYHEEKVQNIRKTSR